jgi:hypothetical protein
MGELLAKLKIPIVSAPRIDITLERHWPLLDRVKTDPSLFHVRIKHEANRQVNDIIVWKRLLNEIYH